VPVTATVNVVAWPTVSVGLAGCAVMTGAACTAIAAALKKTASESTRLITRTKRFERANTKGTGIIIEAGIWLNLNGVMLAKLQENRRLPMPL